MPAVEEVLGGHPLALDAYGRVLEILAALGPVEVRTTRTQVGFRRRRGFGWLWCPGRWLARPASDVVLSIALGRADGSPRWKEVAHPSPRHWVHHLELHDIAELDAEVVAWLAEAAERAG